jgi:periplasmic protein TonB
MNAPQDMSAAELPRHLSPPVWIAAALAAVAIHAGGVALALASMQPDSAVDLGAPGIEIGIELVSPHLDPTDAPVGPDTEAAAAAPAIVEQKAVIEPNDLPKAVPTETDDPERVVAPEETKKPKEDEPKIATVQASPSTESIAAEETATPTVETAPEAPRSVAPAPGTGESALRERQSWQKELAAHFNKYKRYPSDRTMQAAEVVVSFELDRAGNVLSTKIVKGSGDVSFDDAAIGMLRRASPVPQPPPLVADEGLAFTLPVIFRVKDAEATASAAHKPR